MEASRARHEVGPLPLTLSDLECRQKDWFRHDMRNTSSTVALYKRSLKDCVVRSSQTWDAVYTEVERAFGC